MADTKISELPVATSIASPDVAPVVRAGVTMQADISLFGTGSKAAITLRSSGDINDSATFDADNSGIRQKDVNDITMFTLWSDGTFGGNVLIVDKIPDGFEFGPGSASDNVFVGTQIAVNFTDGSGNVAVGNSALANITDHGANTGLGTGAGYTTEAGYQNVFVGNDPHSVEVDAHDLVLIGSIAIADTGVTDNGIAIGSAVTVATNNTAVIGNSSVTDVYFGSVTGAAKLHGKGDAIVFPDSDPHIVGAGYWLAGVLTRSAG